MTTLNLGRVVGQDGEDGRGIVSIEKTATVGLVDTYTITYTDGTTSTFDVTNGQDGTGGGQDYTDLTNKPSINDVTLEGNKSLSELGVQATLTSGTNIKTINNESILGSGNITIEGGGEENSEKDNLLYANLRQLAKLSTFPLYSVKGNIGIIGDSTISGYRGVKIASLLQVDTGYAITDISYPGDTFTGQLNKWNALSSTTKSNLNYVFMQLGLNDVLDTTTSHFRELCATLINKIRQDSPDAVLILCSCVPCKQRFYDLSPNNPARALAAQQVWEDYYNDVKNNYYNADKICYLHSDAMAFDGYNLRKELDSGDHIHENEWGDKIIAFSWCAEAFDNSDLTASKTISSIAVTTPPTKTSYTTDDYFDPTGMVVTATYSDSTTAVISGYTYSPTTKLTTSVTAITISYAGKTTTTPITVTESTKVLESIEATYTQGQTVVYPTTSLDSLKTNLVVVATYDDTSTQTLQANDYTLSGTLTVGTSTVTVTYENKTDTFSVVVSEIPTLVSLTHTGTLQKTNYLAGESFDPTGLTFVATYSDTSTQTVTPTFAPATLSTGDTQVTASYTFNGVTETDVITGITVEAGQWVIGTLNDITHDAYKQKTFDDNIISPYWMYYTSSNYFENRTVTKVCAKGLVAGIEITLYASPITSSPSITGEIEVGHFTLTQDSTPKDYDVIDPQKIPTGYTLAIHYTGSKNQRIMEVPKANVLSRMLAAKYTQNQSTYTVSLDSSGPEYYVEA